MRFPCSTTLAALLVLSSCTNGVDSDDDVQGDGESGLSEESSTETGTSEDEITEDETTDDETDGETTEGETDTDDPCDPFETSEAAGCAAIVGEGFCSEGAVHVPEGSEIEWMNNPPHSGNHYPSWETKGEHAQPVARGNWVHNLEHGWIVLTHNCPADCEAEIEVLRAVIEMRPNASILMTADPLLDGPRFAAISWTWVHEFDAADLDELLCFVDQHHDHAPESVH
jgi:hypothetical protein